MSTLKVNTIQNVSGGSDVSGLGSFVKLSTIDASNSSNIAFTNSITDAFDTYNQYLIVFNGLQFSADAIDLQHRISDSNGIYSSSDYTTRVLDSGGNGNYTGSSFVRFNQNAMGNNSSGSLIYEDCSGHIFMTNFAVNLRYQFHGVVAFGDTSSNKRFCPFGGGVNVNTETTAVNFFSSSGNINTGKFTLYGVRQ